MPDAMLDLNVSGQYQAERAARRSNRRRLVVFSLAFLAVLVPGEIWNFLRPPEYRASARIQITPGDLSSPRPSTQLPAGATSPSLDTKSDGDFLAQIQILTSRPLLEKVAQALAAAGRPLEGNPANTVQQLQNMIQITAAPGTDVLELQAIGTPPEILAAALNSLIGTYRAQLEESHGKVTTDRLAQSRDEAERLEKAVAAKRAALSAFRAHSGIVSSERDENEALAKVKGLGVALNNAMEKSAIADSRVRSLQQQAPSDGKAGTQSKDDPTLASMEQRASQTREEIRDMERTYTQDFMSMDPKARALRARLAELEKQIAGQRVASRQNSLALAQEEAAAARATLERLQSQITADRKGVQEFSGRFAQAKALEEDLAQIERANREAQERVVKLQATELGRRPVFRLLEAASVPQTTFRPDYFRDGAIVLAAAFCIGLIAMWFVELFNRTSPQPHAPPLVVMPQPWPSAGPVPHLAINGMSPALPVAEPPSMALLPGIAPQLRELEQTEVRALLAAANTQSLRACICLLCGLTEPETLELKRADVNTEDGALAVSGGSARLVAIPPWATKALASNGDEEGSFVLRDADGARLGHEQLSALVLVAALDAGLDGPEEITPEVLRHTCVAWTVRQGLKFSELADRVGSLGSGTIARYAALAPAGPKVGGAEIPSAMPALREPPPSA